MNFYLDPKRASSVSSEKGINYPVIKPIDYQQVRGIS